MKNKIIASVIASLFLPMLISLHWAVTRFLSVRIVLSIAMMVAIIVVIYKLSKLLLDEYSESVKDHEKSRKNNQGQTYPHPGQIQED